MVLDSIASTCSPENYFIELLNYWLMYYDGKPTWSVVVEALYDIDLPKLAEDIEHVHATGESFRNFIVDGFFLNKYEYKFHRNRVLSL